MCNPVRVAVVILLGFCGGFLSGCDHSSALSDLKQDQADHAHSLGKAWDEIKALKADAEDASPFEQAMKFAQSQFLKCDHRLTEIRDAMTLIDSSLAKRIEEQRNTLDHTTKKADAAYDNETALAAKLAKLEERIAKDQAELAAVLAQQDQAIEQLAAKPQQPKPEPSPAPVVQINHADTQPLKVTPIRHCPTGRCPNAR
jgi:chromosome segregation ATPase